MNQEKVFGIGPSRTGGTSLAIALRRLGYKTYHHIDFRHFYRLVNKKLKLNDTYLKRFDAIVDLPAAINYKELDKKYPDAKFILTIRKNRKRHLASLHFLHTYVRWLFAIFPRILAIDEQFWGRRHFDKNDYEQRYQQYIKEVRQHFKGRKNKLLVLDITQGDGYEKLCPFLGVAVVEEKFPRANKGMQRKIKTVRKIFSSLLNT